jgi:hypothetical protein
LTTPAPGDPVVSLIVVNFEGADSLTQCVDSLLADDSPPREIFVVDNASTDDSHAVIDALAQRYPHLVTVHNDVNLGYAGAVNAVLPRCRGRYVGIFNMDLVAERGWLAPLVDFLDQHPETAAVNPLLMLEDGVRVNAIGQNVHVTGLGFNRGLGLSRSDAPREPLRISGVQGAALLVRRALLQETGGMDSSGFVYHEDVNLSWLLRMMGHDLHCVPASVVRHEYFLSMHAEKLYLLERNRVAMLLSHLERPTLLRLAPMLLLSEAMLWGYALLRGPAFLRAKARSYAWLWRTRAARRERRAFVQGLRRCSDAQVLDHMHRSYSWRQLSTLAGERGEARRDFGPRASGGRSS